MKATTAPGFGSFSQLSLAPLYLEIFGRSLGTDPDRLLSTATGFLVGTPDAESGELFQAHLVTAWHVLAGLNAQTLEPLKPLYDADYLAVHYVPDSGDTSRPHKRKYELTRTDEEGIKHNLWLEHPRGSAIDVGALPIGSIPRGVVCAPLDPSSTSWPTLGHLFSKDHPSRSEAERDTPLPLRVTDRLFIIGYPFGDKGTWPAAIWTTAPIASEPVAQYNKLPAFLVDSRSRPGQSGAPVVLHIRPDDPVWANGDVYVHEQEVIALVGLYSGRIAKDSDLGMVWTNQAIREVLSTG